MKYAVLVLINLFIFSAAFSQAITDTALQEKAYITYDSYMQKSLKKRKTARTLLYTGGGIVVGSMLTGGIVYSGGNEIIGTFITLSGITAGFLVGVLYIPFSISSDKWERRALQIQPAVGVERVYLPLQSNAQPSVGIAIKL